MSGRIARSGRKADIGRRSKPVPSTLDWEAWLGPAQWRPYAARRFIIRSPGAAGGTSAPVRSATWPATRATCRSWRSTCATRSRSRPSAPSTTATATRRNSKIKFEFPELDGRAAFTMHWYDGGNLPAERAVQRRDARSEDRQGRSTSRRRRAAASSSATRRRCTPPATTPNRESQIVGDVKELDVDFPRSPGHEKEWFIAMRDSKKAGDVELPGLLRPADRDDPARQPGRLQARPRRMGSGESEAAQRSFADAHRAADVPRRVRSLSGFVQRRIRLAKRVC